MIIIIIIIMHIFSTLSKQQEQVSLFFLHFQSAEYIGERVREIAQPFLFIYIHLYVVFSRRFLSSNSVCVRYRKQKWEKQTPRNACHLVVGLMVEEVITSSLFQRNNCGSPPLYLRTSKH